MSGKAVAFMVLSAGGLVLGAVLLLVLQESRYREHYAVVQEGAGFVLQVPLPCSRFLPKEVRLKITPPLPTSIEQAHQAISGRIELLFDGAGGPRREQMDLSHTRSYIEGEGIWAVRIIGLAPTWSVSCPASQLQLRAHDLNIDPQRHALEVEVLLDPV